MNEVIDYIYHNYDGGEPIFTSDIHIERVSDDCVKQQLKRLTDMGRLLRYEKGVYFLQKESRLKSGVHLSANMVAKYKYISRNGKVMGFYSGYTFANQLGISQQVPMKVEIVSNESAPIVRDVKVGSQVFTIRRARIKVTEENHRILQYLELLKDIEQYSDEPMEDVQKRIVAYTREIKITRQQIDRYIDQFPIRIYKSIYEMRLDHVFA